MKKIPVSSLLLNQTPFVIEERDPESNLTAARPVLSFLAGNEVVEVNLETIREFKALFMKAERHLLLRSEQALLSKNLTLDLGN